MGLEGKIFRIKTIASTIGDLAFWLRKRKAANTEYYSSP